MGIWVSALLLFLQLAQPPGVVSGVVRSKEGVPAASVRVFLIPVRDAGDVTHGVVYESITETTNAGHYRLEAPPGRYYLAAGSVQSPTYYPGVSSITSGRVIEIVSGESAQADFSGFNPAAPRFDPATAFFAIGLAMVGEISGTVRSADGTPLAGNAVIAVPAANTQTTGMAARFRTTTDNSGHYRFTTLLPGSYHLATGYAERPVFFPGVRSLSEATVVTVAASAKVAADFVVAPAAPGVSVQGRVASSAGVAISDADVRLVSRHNSGLALSLPQRSLTRGYTAADGSFELQDILDGSYDLEVRVSGITPVVSELVVEKESLKAIAVAVPVAMLSGRIVLEDGMPLDTEAIGAVVASTVLNPNLTSRVTFPLNAAGEFGRLIEPGRFKLSLENVPEGYAVASIKAATVDLLREDLDVTESANLRIEIILSRK